MDKLTWLLKQAIVTSKFFLIVYLNDKTEF